MTLIRLMLCAVCGLLLLTAQARADGTALKQALRDAHAAGELRGLHAVLVLKDGQRMAEVYFDGPDQRWGTPLGQMRHGPDTLHDLRSVTKSVVGLLYGIALHQGHVPGLGESLLAQYPEQSGGDPARAAITVNNALDMTMGLRWNEDLPYTDPRNSEIAMERSGDPVGYVLSRKLVAPPGTRWRYNGGATAVIGDLIARGTGQRLEAYARDALFAPLGIGRVDWVQGLNGQASAASGLRLRARDLAKIGQILLQGGRWQGRQVVPRSWVDEIFTPRATTASGQGYARFWWLDPDHTPPRWGAGFGNGGQRLVVDRARQAVTVIYAGNYNDPAAWRLSLRIMRDFVNPALDAVR